MIGIVVETSALNVCYADPLSGLTIMFTDNKGFIKHNKPLFKDRLELVIKVVPTRESNATDKGIQSDVDFMDNLPVIEFKSDTLEDHTNANKHRPTSDEAFHVVMEDVSDVISRWLDIKVNYGLDTSKEKIDALLTSFKLISPSFYIKHPKNTLIYGKNHIQNIINRI